MELRDHLKIAYRYKWLVIAIVLIATVSASVISYYQAPKYKVSLAFTVNVSNRQETPDYQFDGYYSIQSSELFSMTIISWFLTPSVLVEIYEDAGVAPNITTLEELTGRFKTKQYSSQNFVVLFKELDQPTAEKLSSSIIKIVEAKAADLNKDATDNSIFEVRGSSPVIVEAKLATWLIGLVAFLASLLFSWILVYFIDYMRGQPPSPKLENELVETS